MEPAVTTVLADFRLTAWDAFGGWRFSRLQTEPEDRFSGRRRSPQQAESLTAAVRRLLVAATRATIVAVISGSRTARRVTRTSFAG